MAISEPARLALYNRLGEVIGIEHAETLMSSLPIQSAVELATKRDIDELRDEIRLLRSEFNDLHKALRHQMMFVIAAMTALTGIFSVIVGLIT